MSSEVETSLASYGRLGERIRDSSTPLGMTDVVNGAKIQSHVKSVTH